jgi:hypothetical protein
LEAVTGRRIFYVHELHRLITAENTVRAYQSRAKATNWQAWMVANPGLANLLFEAERVLQELETDG